jgi:predicted transcriptional regulator
MKRKHHFELGRRERQLVETVYRLAEASVSDVLNALEVKPKPAYSTVRTILNTLVHKRVLTSRRDGIRFLYRPVTPKEQIQSRAMSEIVNSLFGGSVMEAFVSLLDVSGNKLSNEDFKRLEQIIQQSRQQKKD